VPARADLAWFFGDRADVDNRFRDASFSGYAKRVERIEKFAMR
jgi:hypothetical protein